MFWILFSVNSKIKTYSSRPLPSVARARKGAKKGVGSFVLPGNAFRENESFSFSLKTIPVALHRSRFASPTDPV
jgi:hypothetical protein